MIDLDAPTLPTETVERLLRAALAGDGRAQVHVSGESMRPWLAPGDSIEVEAVSPGSLAPGDILLLEGLVVHRLLERTPYGLIVRGDAARATDPLWSSDRVIGRVTARVRDGRRTPVDRFVPRALSRWHAEMWRWRRRIGRALPRR